MGINLPLPSLRPTTLCSVLALIVAPCLLPAQRSIGGIVGWTRSDHWYRSTVSAGLLYAHAFTAERLRARISTMCHIPVYGRRDGPFDGQPSPTSAYVGNASTHDRYWGADADADVLFRIARNERRGLEAYALSGGGYRIERFDYHSRVVDPATGSTTELDGHVYRDRFAFVAGFGASMDAGNGKLFVEGMTDAWSYVADRNTNQAPIPLERYGIRFGFVHPIGGRKAQ